MTTYQHSADADIAADTLFGFLADPRNLPRYFPQMTAAEPESDGVVHVEAHVHGSIVESEAWIDADQNQRRLK